MTNPPNTDPPSQKRKDVMRPDTCLIYAKTLSEQGYGMLYSGGRRIRAHRAMYEAVKGPIPEGLVLDHLCRNRACVNPDHLEAVTNRENILRGVGASAQHAKKTHCTEGHRLAPGNLVTITTRPNVRRCRICDNVLRKKRYHRNKQGESHMGDLYLEQMVKDLEAAEKALRGDICYRGMSFSQARLDDSQANVDRLHKLILDYKSAQPTISTTKDSEYI